MRHAAYPLLEAHPRLAAALPVAGLLRGATPVTPLPDGSGVFLKRDDLSAADYGGNKIRKLDFLLAGARQRGARELVVFGYAGSNFVAATAWHGRRLGLHTIGYLLPQFPAGYVADNLRVGLHAGAELLLAPSTAALARAAALRSVRGLVRHGRWPVWIPPGGSSPLGVVGYVNAALELRRQVQAGELPEPDDIYVAFSSMGTVAGLALGLELARMRSRIVAVQVVDRRFCSPEKLRRLLDRSGKFLQRLAPDLRFGAAAQERIRVRTEFLGAEYGRPTEATRAAMQRFAVSGAQADSAYSGKALACLYHDLDAGTLRGKSVLFWHTFNGHGLPPGVGRGSPAHVPAGLETYFVREEREPRP